MASPSPWVYSLPESLTDPVVPGTPDPSPWVYLSTALLDPSGIPPSPWTYQSELLFDPSGLTPSPWSYASVTVSDPGGIRPVVSVWDWAASKWVKARVWTAAAGQPWR